MIRIFTLLLLIPALGMAQTDPSQVIQEFTPPIPFQSRFLAPEAYKLWVMQYAAEYGIPLDIAIRLCYEESGWRPTLLSYKNRDGSRDTGLYQLNTRYFRVKTTEGNIQAGLKHLAWCYRVTGKWRMAVIAYNCGYNNRLHPSKTTIEYAERVVSGGL
jgi:soluble lytic murein transglycosylase-like protein